MPHVVTHAGSATPAAAAAGTLRLSPKEQAYVAVVQQANAAAAAAATAAPSSSTAGFDLVREFTSACRAHEERAHETAMSGCWALLGDVLGEAKARGVQPATTAKFTEALLQGEYCVWGGVCGGAGQASGVAGKSPSNGGAMIFMCSRYMT